MRTDPDDPIRNTEAVPTVSWFHTSTHAQWPPMEAEARDRALHLGTYEAAIDTMYYRMDKMDEAARPFFLHRVTLTPDAAIDPVIHTDSGATFTGFLDLDVVTAGGFTGRRYINAIEHRGSISLAIALEAICEVQTMPIPNPADQLAIDSHAAAAEATLAGILVAADAEHRAAVEAYDATEHQPQDPDPTVQRVLDLIGKSDRGRIDLDRNKQTWAAERRFDEQLRDYYLSSAVSVERCEEVSSALRTRARQTGESLHALYRLHAPLMLAPDQVVDTLVAREPYRSAVLRA